MDLTIIWIWPSNGFDHYMDLTVIWIWPLYGSDLYMDLTVIWIWQSYGTDRHMDLTVIWIWPSYGSDRPKHSYEPDPAQYGRFQWPSYLSINSIKPNAHLRTSYDFLLEVGEYSNVQNINTLVLALVTTCILRYLCGMLSIDRFFCQNLKRHQIGALFVVFCRISYPTKILEWGAIQNSINQYINKSQYNVVSIDVWCNTIFMMIHMYMYFAFMFLVN